MKDPGAGALNRWLNRGRLIKADSGDEEKCMYDFNHVRIDSAVKGLFRLKVLEYYSVLFD
jgi:hypothetical protein